MPLAPGAPAPDELDQRLCPVQDGVQLVLRVVESPANANGGASLDYTHAGQLWAFAFTTVVGLYLVSSYVGSLLRFLRGR